jgi:hypothetical protein
MPGETETKTKKWGQAKIQSNNKGVCHTLWPCPFTLRSMLMQKKNYGNSNISPCKNIPNLPKIL